MKVERTRGKLSAENRAKPAEIDLNFHDLQPECAGRLYFDEGWTIYDVSILLGHADVKTWSSKSGGSSVSTLTAHARQQAAYTQALRQLEFLTPAQAGAILQTSAWTITRAIRSGELDAIRIGATWRIRPQALDQWATAGAARGTTLWRAV